MLVRGYLAEKIFHREYISEKRLRTTVLQGREPVLLLHSVKCLFSIQQRAAAWLASFRETHMVSITHLVLSAKLHVQIKPTWSE